MVEKITEKDIVILSHNDFDGTGSPIVLNYISSITGDNVVGTYFTKNGEVENTIETITGKYGTDIKLFICDHSPTKEYYDLMVSRGLDFHVYDHHKSSELKDLEYVTLDLTKSATQLFFDDVCPDEIKKDLERFVYHVNDYDMWIHESPHSKRINELLYETSIKEFVERFSIDPDVAFKPTEEILVSSAEKKRTAYIDKAEKTVTQHKDEDWNTYGIVFAEQHQSELGHQLIERLGLNYIYIINCQAGKVSLRCDGSVDVSLIAKKVAGPLYNSSGGHKEAAGFTFKKEQLPRLYHMILGY